MVETSFKISDAVSYCKLSGDANPVHLIEEYAKRTQFGERIVYGMLLLERAYALFPALFNKDLAVNFIRFARYDEVYQYEYTDYGFSICNLRGDIIVDALVKGEDAPSAVQDLEHLMRNDVVSKKISAPLDLPEDFNSLCFDNHEFRKPDLSLVTLLRDSSYVVGMHNPGLNSLYLSVKITAVKNDRSFNCFRLAGCDKRLGITKIYAEGPWHTLEILAKHRAPPLLDLKLYSEKIESFKTFDNNTYFIIFGVSRGLGKLFFRLINACTENVYGSIRTMAKDTGHVFNYEVFSDSVMLPKISGSKLFIINCISPKIVPDSVRDDIHRDKYFAHYFQPVKAAVDNYRNSFEFISVVNLSSAYIDDVKMHAKFINYVDAKIHVENKLNEMANIQLKNYRLVPMYTDQNVGIKAIDPVETINTIRNIVTDL